MSSLDIARVFEKEHYNVLRDIRELGCPEEFNALNFEFVEYEDEKGEMRPAFSMTRDGAMLLIMGYTGPIAMQLKIAYIQRFNEMENQLNAYRALEMAGFLPDPEGECYKLDAHNRPWVEGECPLKLAPYVFGYDNPTVFNKMLKAIGGVPMRKGTRSVKKIITVEGMKRIKEVLMRDGKN